MIYGHTLDQLGDLIIKQNAEKRDFIAPATRLRFASTPTVEPTLSFDLGGQAIDASLTPLATRQIGSWAGIPAKYLERLSEPENRHLLQSNVQHWLSEAGDSKRLVRMLSNGHNVVRAFLSDRYRPLDNYDLAMHILPRLRQGGMEVKSSALTDTRIYLQAVDTRLVAAIEHKDSSALDEVFAGVVVSNSEVGAGSLSIEPMIYRLRCTNGMIAGTGLRRAHLGRSLGSGDDAFEVFSDATKQLTDAALWAQVGDTLEHALSESTFRAIVAKMQTAADTTLPANPTYIVEVTAQNLGLSTDEKDAVMRHLFTGGDGLTAYALANAVTRTAQDARSYDRAIELERLGSDVLAYTADTFSIN